MSNNMSEQQHVTVGFSGSQMMLAILGGAVAGAAIAYLTAPRSGRETRAQLKEMATEARDQITGAVKEGTDTARQIPGAVKVAGAAARTAFVDKMREGAV
jgi:gas vesicle protein